MKKLSTVLALALIVTAMALPVSASGDKSPNIPSKTTTAQSTTKTTKTTKTTTNALTGYTVTINDKTTLATNTQGKVVNGVLVHYFVSASGTVLGSISADTYRKIAQNGVDNKTIPTETKDQTVWFANQFNAYRGLGTTTATTTTNNTVDIEEYRQEVIRLTNEERVKAGLPALEINEDAMALAQTRAKEKSQDYSHTRPNGLPKVINGLSVNENIYRTPTTPQDALNGWMNSSGHKGNILNKISYEIGVGVYQAPNGTWYWVQLFVW